MCYDGFDILTAACVGALLLYGALFVLYGTTKNKNDEPRG